MVDKFILLIWRHSYKLPIENKEKFKQDRNVHPHLSLQMTLMILPKHWAQADHWDIFVVVIDWLHSQPRLGPNGFHQVTGPGLGTNIYFFFSGSKYKFIWKPEILFLPNAKFSHFPNYPDWRCACVTYDDCDDYDPGDHTWGRVNNPWPVIGCLAQSMACDWLIAWRV